MALVMQDARELIDRGENLRFAQLVRDGYNATAWIGKDYPRHCEHYFTKFVPGVFTGERNIVGCYTDDMSTMAGVIILKKSLSDGEHKICTLFVQDVFRRCGVATRLLEEGFEWLGTTRPLITIAEYKLEQFAGIIRRYGWEETAVLEVGFYNDHSREHVFNGA